jgi:hypothetical protein
VVGADGDAGLRDPSPVTTSSSTVEALSASWANAGAAPPSTEAASSKARKWREAGERRLFVMTIPNHLTEAKLNNPSIAVNSEKLFATAI